MCDFTLEVLLAEFFEEVGFMSSMATKDSVVAEGRGSGEVSLRRRGMAHGHFRSNMPK